VSEDWIKRWDRADADNRDLRAQVAKLECELAEARAALEAMTAERDRYRDQRDTTQAWLSVVAADRDNLRAAIEPTAENVEAYWLPLMENTDWRLSVECSEDVRIVLAAIAARAEAPQAQRPEATASEVATLPRDHYIAQALEDIDNGK
jgi:chromosome segregation ATPase